MSDSDYAVRKTVASGDWDARADALPDGAFFFVTNKLLLVASLIVALLVGYAVTTAPLSLEWQTLFGVLCLLVALFVDRKPGRLVSIGLMALSTLLSARYMYWRLTESIDIYGPHPHLGRHLRRASPRRGFRPSGRRRR